MVRPLILSRKNRPGRWQARVKVPADLIKFTGKAGFNKDIHAPSKEEAAVIAQPWADEINARLEQLRREHASDEPTRLDLVSTSLRSKKNVQANFNLLVREAFAAQDEFDRFDCDTVNRPGDMVKLRQLTADWDEANVQLIRFTVRNAEALIREFGGRVVQRDREAIE